MVWLSGTVCHILRILKNNALESAILAAVTRFLPDAHQFLNSFDQDQNQGLRGQRKVKDELNQGLVMINLYVKPNVHSSNVKQVIDLKVAERRTDGRMTTIGIN